jgi:hypothetical protein
LRLQPHRQHQRRLPGVRNAYDGGGEGVKRWALNIATVLSLLLFIGTSVLWVRSYWVAEYFGFFHSSGGFERLIASHGDLVIYCATSNEPNAAVGFRHDRGMPLSFRSPPGQFPVQR